MIADFVGFDAEFMLKLRHDRLVFVTEVLEIGKKHGLSEGQVDRILEEAEKSGVGIRDEAFVCMEPENDG